MWRVNGLKCENYANQKNTYKAATTQMSLNVIYAIANQRHIVSELTKTFDFTCFHYYYYFFWNIRDLIANASERNLHQFALKFI